jgi:predicted amidophosphoribosyltransferase
VRRRYGRTVLFDLVLPTRCVVCRRGGPQLCDACARGLRRLAGPRCARCSAPTVWPVAACRECSGRRLAFAQARSAVVYDAAARAAVLAWKERGLRRLTAAFAAVVVDALDAPDLDLTYVAADRERRRKRGHDPPRALAHELGKLWGRDVLPLLTRNGRSAPQRAQTLAARRANVRGVFAAARSPPAIVLVDDVYTSGATVNAAASALRRAGARRVEVITFARAVRGYMVSSQA